MPRKFNPEGAPPPPFYSHGVEVGAGERLVFLSGQVGVGRDGVLAEDAGGQARLAVENVKAALAAGGMGLEDVVKFTFYLTDPTAMDAIMPAIGGLLVQPPAAATMLFVSGLADPRMKIEIEAVAAKASA